MHSWLGNGNRWFTAYIQFALIGFRNEQFLSRNLRKLFFRVGLMVAIRFFDVDGCEVNHSAQGFLFENLNLRIAYFYMAFVPAQFLKSDMACARAIAQRGSGGSIMPLGRRGLLVKIHIQHLLAIQLDLNLWADASDMVMIPLSRFVSLDHGSDSLVKAGGEFGRRDLHGCRVISWIHHLEFHAVKGGIAIERCAQSRSTIAACAEFPIEIEDEITVFLFAEQPASNRVVAIQNAAFNLSGIRFLLHWVSNLSPVAGRPTGGHAVVGKKKFEAGRLRHLLIGVTTGSCYQCDERCCPQK